MALHPSTTSTGPYSPWPGSDDLAAQDARHAEAEVVPEFYERDARGIPPRWLRRVRASLRSIGPRFCAARMLDEYLAGPYRAPLGG